MTPFSLLVIDDEVDFMETLVNRLRKRRMDAHGVVSGEQGLKLLEERPFDVVLLDVKMPGGMGGMETLREIRRRHPRSEVILLTGHASIETSLEGIRAGAFDYLLKPVKFDDLLQKITAALQKKSPRTGANGTA